MSAFTTPNGFNIDDSGARVVVDPVTRIEGHMRCEVNIDEDNIIRNAVSTGTMWRGLEVILKVATRVMPGLSPSGSAVFAPAPMRLPPYALWKMPLASRFRKTPIRSATSCSLRCRRMTIWSIFIICMRWTG